MTNQCCIWQCKKTASHSKMNKVGGSWGIFRWFHYCDFHWDYYKGKPRKTLIGHDPLLGSDSTPKAT